MRALILPALLMASAVFAKPVFTATCGTPVGTRCDQVNSTLVEKPDGFDGVNPTFIIDDQRSTKITYIWGPAEWARNELKMKAAAQEAIIISMTVDKITAIAVEGDNGITKMFSLFPKKGLVLFSQHRYIDLAGGVPTVGTFHAKCSFSE